MDNSGSIRSINHRNINTSKKSDISPYWPKAQVIPQVKISVPIPNSMQSERQSALPRDKPIGHSIVQNFSRFGRTFKRTLNKRWIK
jgi:hypothetical protein